MKRFWLISVLVLLVIAWLSGCEYPLEGGTVEINDGRGKYSAGVRETRLEDGTRCAVIVSSTGAGITCDWSKNDLAAPQ